MTHKDYIIRRRSIGIASYAAFISGVFLVAYGIMAGVSWVAMASIACFAPLPYLFWRNYRLEREIRGLTVTWKEYARLVFAPIVPLAFVLAVTVAAIALAITAQGPIALIFVYYNFIFVAVLLLMFFFPQILVFSYGAKRMEDKGVVERVTAIARKLGVYRVKVYSLPWKGMKIANAMQTGFFSNKSIFISDYLLQEMGPREVDTIVAHELAHAKRGHVVKKAALIAPPILIEINLLAGYFITQSPLMLAAFFGVVVFELGEMPLLIMPLSRRFETEADLLAVDATGDAEAAASALGRLRELGRAQRTSKRRWWLNSHPTFETRIEDIRRRGADIKTKEGTAPHEMDEEALGERDSVF